ncbi:MAG: MBL fold metallo-hydrolase [Chloroflexi bacterium]|nr:MBL fold metallo-hydrolase [Chloroflexota bacterium]
MDNQQTLPTSRHFQLYQLSDGVYVALQKTGGWATSNAGIIDLGDRTLVFDTFLTPQAATDLRAAAESLTGRPVTMVINSHYHNDHVWGNQVFAATTDILASTATHQWLTMQGQTAIAWQREHAPAQLAALEQRHQNATKSQERQQLSLQMAYYQSIVEALPLLQPRLPNLTFDAQFAIHGSQRSALALTYGIGHTPGDVILFLPAEGILFAGDLINVNYHPYLADGDPGEVNRIIDMVASKLQPQIVVPGHGEIGNSEDLQAMTRYLTVLTEMALIELAYKLENPAQLEEKIAGLSIPTAFATWYYSNFFADNLRFLYQRMMKAYAD